LSSATAPVAFRVIGALGTIIGLLGGAGTLAWQVSLMM